MDDAPHALRGVPGFGRYWTAAALSAFGTSISAVAIPVLVVNVLAATPFQVGLVNAAQYLPYAFFGLFVGVLVDRRPRRPLLVAAGLGRAVCLAAIPVLWLFGLLQLGLLLALLFVFGTLSVLGFAATQSLLPRLVPRSSLYAANARLDQADAVSQTAGPALGGAIVGLITAPIALLVDAVSYLVDAVLLAGLRVHEPPSSRGGQRGWLRSEIAEGLRFTYGHRVLGRLAFSTHLWFLANAAVLTVLAPLALRTLALPAPVYGVLLALSGLATFVGASLAPFLGRRLGVGPTIIAARFVYPLAWLCVAAMMHQAHGGGPVATVVLGVALVLHGLAGGCENTNEMGYRQAVTPDALLGRTSATIRSANRTVAAVGALAGGAVAGAVGEQFAVLAVVLVFVVAAVVAVASPLRTVRSTEGPERPV